MGEAPSAGRPAPLLEVPPQERVQRRTVEQVVDPVPEVPSALHWSCRRVVEQLVDMLSPLDFRVAEQVVDVPKICVSTPRCSHSPPCTAAGRTADGSADARCLFFLDAADFGAAERRHSRAADGGTAGGSSVGLSGQRSPRSCAADGQTVCSFVCHGQVWARINGPWVCTVSTLPPETPSGTRRRDTQPVQGGTEILGMIVDVSSIMQLVVQQSKSYVFFALQFPRQSAGHSSCATEGRFHSAVLEQGC